MISLLLGKPFDVSTEFCLQYQFHSESITNNEKLKLVKELVRKLKLEDHSNHKNWETPEADGYGNGYEIRSEYVIKYIEANRNMVTELYHTQKEFMSYRTSVRCWLVARTRSSTTWMCHSSPISSIC